MPLFSVVIPVFNRRDLLRQTLASLLAQQDGVPEIIVVDDGSTDGTLEYLRAEHPDLPVISQQNKGPGAARNRGIERASGDYIAFLDSDDLWFPWTARVYRDVILASGAHLVFGKPAHFHDESELSPVQIPEGTPEWLGFADYHGSGDEWRWWGASSFVVRRDRLDSVRFVEESINGEDADFVMKLGHGVPLAQITGSPTFGYREHAGSVMKNFAKTVAGARNLVDTELSGHYPGGDARGRERRKILGRHLRPVILDLLRGGNKPEGWKLFRETLTWHIEDRRWRFIAATVATRLLK